MPTIRVLIADDHVIVRAGVKALLLPEADMIIVGEVADLCSVRQQVALLHPNVLLLSASLLGETRMQVIEHLLRDFPCLKVLVLAMHTDIPGCRTALAMGAAGYLAKTNTDTELQSAIRSVASGRGYVNVPLAGGRPDLLLDADNAAEEINPNALSKRETQVLTLLSQGHTNQAIAEYMKVSDKTVATFRARLMKKLGLKTRAEIVHYALKTGHFKNNDSLPAT